MTLGATYGALSVSISIWTTFLEYRQLNLFPRNILIVLLNAWR